MIHPSSPSPSSWLRAVGSRVGHDFIWAIIAVLFCLVELAVFLTEFNPGRLFRRTAARDQGTGHFRSETVLRV